MNSINILTSTVDNLWLWTYGIIAGWGATLSIMIVALVFLSIRLIRQERKLRSLENRLIAAERDFNLAINKY